MAVGGATTGVKGCWVVTGCEAGSGGKGLASGASGPTKGRTSKP